MVQNELYLTEPIQFLRTCTLKNEFLAWMSRNNDVTSEYQESLPEKLLPYYRHMKGEYILENETTSVYGVTVSNKRIYTKFDTQMYVRSFDTTEQIKLSRESLEQHSKTAEWYRIPNTEYFKLCSKYPTQSDLIKNIIYPIPDDVDPADTAIENFTLLQYDEELLEENERVSILSAINRFLESVRVRWSVKEFCFEHMYPIALQDVIWNQLYNCIMTQRILNIRTSSVCSYHIWEYLKSRGLKDYRDVLSMKKALFLYRNIDYLLQNQGTRKTFSILIGSLLSDMNITIDQKALVQKITSTSTVTTSEIETKVSDVDTVITSDEEETTNEDTTEEAPVLMMAAAPLMATASASNDSEEETDSDSDTSSQTTTKTVKSTVMTVTSTTSVGTDDDCSPNVEILSFETGDATIMAQARAFMTGTSAIAAKTAGNFTTAVLAMSNETVTSTNIDKTTNGYYETKDALYTKEKQASLEYTNDNIFAMSTATQDSQFSASPHSLLLTKVHEINADIGSDLYSSLYAFYITQALLYRSSIRHLDFAVHVNNNDGVDLWLMSGDELLSLLFYSSMKSINVELTYPPFRVFLKGAYKTEFPEISETFVWNQRTYKTSDYLTEHGFSDMVAHPDKFTSPDYCDKILGIEADNFLENYIQMHHKPTAKGFMIFDRMMRDRMTFGFYNLHLFDAPSYESFVITDDYIGKTVIIDDKNVDIDENNIETYRGQTASGQYITRYSSYVDMFNQRPEIKEVIDKYNISEDYASSYSELFVLLLQSLFSQTGSSVLQSVSTSDKSVEAMKTLFKSMCSYNISFVDSSANQDSMSLTLPGFPSETWDEHFSVMWKESRFVPFTEVSMTMKDLVHSTMFGDSFYIAHCEDMYTDSDYMDPEVQQISTMICTDRLWNFTPVTTYQILYNIGGIYGILHVDILLRLIRTLQYCEDKFCTDRTRPEYIFLKGQGCIVELEDSETGVIYSKKATGTIKPGGVEMTVDEYLAQSRDFYENEEYEVATMFSREKNWDCWKYEPVYYVQRASGKVKIENVKFIGYADSLDEIKKKKEGMLVYINKYGEVSKSWIGCTKYLYYKSKWYEPVIELEKTINIAEE